MLCPWPSLLTPRTQQPEPPAPHPLAPLTAAEIEAASSAVKSAKGLGETARFVYVSLHEPAKHEVIAFEEGGPAPDRLVKMIIREHAERATYEAVVRLARRRGHRVQRRCPASSRASWWKSS